MEQLKKLKAGIKESKKTTCLGLLVLAPSIISMSLKLFPEIDAIEIVALLAGVGLLRYNGMDMEVFKGW